MKNQFKLFGGQYIDDLLDYIEKYIEKYPDVEVFVGTDSNEIGRGRANFATTICFQHPRHGVHVIFKRDLQDNLKDLFSRMWAETIMSEEVAKFITPTLLDIGKEVTVDCDIASDMDEGSHVAYQASLGYLRGQGYAARAKPDAWAATRAADLLCRY